MHTEFDPSALPVTDEPVGTTLPGQEGVPSVAPEAAVPGEQTAESQGAPAPLTTTAGLPANWDDSPAFRRWKADQQRQYSQLENRYRQVEEQNRALLQEMQARAQADEEREYQSRLARAATPQEKARIQAEQVDRTAQRRLQEADARFAQIEAYERLQGWGEYYVSEGGVPREVISAMLSEARARTPDGAQQFEILQQGVALYLAEERKALMANRAQAPQGVAAPRPQPQPQPQLQPQPQRTAATTVARPGAITPAEPSLAQLFNQAMQSPHDKSAWERLAEAQRRLGK